MLPPLALLRVCEVYVADSLRGRFGVLIHRTARTWQSATRESSSRRPFLDVTQAQWQAHLDVNLNRVASTSGRAAARLSAERGTGGKSSFPSTGRVWRRSLAEISAYSVVESGRAGARPSLAREPRGPRQSAPRRRAPDRDGRAWQRNHTKIRSRLRTTVRRSLSRFGEFGTAEAGPKGPRSLLITPTPTT